jgi:hypothetical protein
LTYIDKPCIIGKLGSSLTIFMENLGLICISSRGNLHMKNTTLYPLPMQIRLNSNPKILKVVGNNSLTPYIAVNGRLSGCSYKESKKYKTIGKALKGSYFSYANFPWRLLGLSQAFQ